MLLALTPTPTPFSLLCAILLCLPLAIIFTFTTTSSTDTGGAAATFSPFPIPTTTTNITSTKTNPIIITPINSINNNNTSLIPPQIKNQSTSSNTKEEDNDDDDSSLFELASRVNPNPELPIKKLAFLFLTTTPLPFAPLWERFFPRATATDSDKPYNVYVHAHYPGLNRTTHFKGVFSGRVIPSKPTRRHSPTLVSAARRLLAHALLHDESNTMFALLSPSCIPIHSFNYTYTALVTNSSRSFVEILKNEPHAYDRWAARGEDAMLPEVEFEDFRIGSQFWVVKRKHARMIVSDRRLWSKFKLPCLRDDTCYPDEHYFPTLLNMVDSRGCVPCTLTHVDWKGSRGGHPRTYGPNEVGPELIRRLREDRPRYGDHEEINGSDSSRGDRFLFARKFSPGSLQQLMSIANDFLFKD